MAKDIVSTIRDRVSIRDYSQQMISDEIIQELLESAHFAPSAGNLQPWEFYVVKNKEKIQELVAATNDQEWMADAPVVITVCARPAVSANKYGDRGSGLYVIQDTAAAIENILLTAEEYDLGSCWVGAFDDNRVKDILGIKQQLWPVALVTIGYPQERVTDATSRRSLDDVTTFIN
ncbi:nitroreductase family protein [Halanaerobaculum tunisiense]